MNKMINEISALMWNVDKHGHINSRPRIELLAHGTRRWTLGLLFIQQITNIIETNIIDKTFVNILQM